jgi:hypothetical protein
MESVVDPPVIPIIKRPPFLGVAALAVLLINAGDTAAMRPRADTRVMKSRRVIFPPVNKFSSSFSFDIVIPLSMAWILLALIQTVKV